MTEVQQRVECRERGSERRRKGDGHCPRRPAGNGRRPQNAERCQRLDKSVQKSLCTSTVCSVTAFIPQAAAAAYIHTCKQLEKTCGQLGENVQAAAGSWICTILQISAEKIQKSGGFRQKNLKIFLRLRRAAGNV
jgi:hypothetical protein